MAIIDTLFMTKTAEKPYPFGAAHTYIQWNLDLTKSLGTGQICSLNGGFVISKTSI